MFPKLIPAGSLSPAQWHTHASKRYTVNHLSRNPARRDFSDCGFFRFGHDGTTVQDTRVGRD